MPAPMKPKSMAVRGKATKDEFEFQSLISQLNSQFRCLTHRIADLAHENTDLRARAASALPAKSSRRAAHELPRNESGGFFEEDLPPARSTEAKWAQPENLSFKQLDALEASAGNGDPKPESQVIVEKPASGKKQPQALEAPESKRGPKPSSRVTVQEPASCEQVEAPERGESKWRSTRASIQDIHFKSPISWEGSHALHDFRRSEISSKITMAMTSIRLFDYLDGGHKGKLSVEDLMDIMERAGEAATYEVLESVALQLTAETGAATEAADIGLDFRAFSLLMDEEDADESEVAGSPRESCKDALRRACRQLKARALTPSYRATNHMAEDARDKTLFERYAPGLLETVPPIVILLNALVAGLGVDHPEREDLWETFEYIFVALYTIEFAAKMQLFGCRGFWRGRDRWWNLFDFVCLAVSLADLSFKIAVSIIVPGDVDSGGTLFTMIKILRLSRLARLVRTLRFHIFLELKKMVLGVVSGIRVLTWAIVLLLMLTYLVGVGTTNLLGKNEPEFKDMRSSMFTLFRCWTEGCAAYDGTPLAERLRAEYGFLWMSFHILMTMFVTVGLFNLIMAIFIDNVVTNQLMRKHCDMVDRTPEIMARFKQLFAGFIKDGNGVGIDSQMSEERHTLSVWDSLWSAMADRGKVQMDIKGIEKDWQILRRMNFAITKEVFQSWLKDEDFQTLLDEADIDVSGRSELFDVLDVDMGGQLSMDELTTGLMRMRGAVTKSDIVAMRLKVRYLTGIIENWMDVS